MLAKTHSYLITQLPTILENIRQNHEQRQQRIESMTQDQDAFIESFLSNNQYFYLSQTELFFYYDGLHYQNISEDDILYNVLSSITKDRNLMSWKQRTRIHIMKRIRENNSLFKSIPESETIQFVLELLYPTIFSTRNEAKYFLTVLGDNILRKNTNLIHYISINAKPFLRELNNICQQFIGSNLSQTFKHKFHDHSYDDCRLIRINDSIKTDAIWSSIFNNPVLDLFCVAIHYSVRYGSSDNFALHASNVESLVTNVFYLKDINSSTLVNHFIKEFMDLPIDDETQYPVLTNLSLVNPFDVSLNRTPYISWKNVLYLWKQFLDNKNLPPVMFHQTLKDILIEKLEPIYNADNDCFIGIYSKQLPVIQKFIYFWNETIILDETEGEFEIEEMTKLFRRWCITHGESPSNMNEKQILDLIGYFFPSIEIDRDKYISGIRCLLWDKQMDIQMSLENLKEICRIPYISSATERRGSPSINKNISIYEAYNHYCKYYSNINNAENSTLEKRLIVSKSYFEKYILDYLGNYVVDSKFLTPDWYIL
jgi:hypothetical protein